MKALDRVCLVMDDTFVISYHDLVRFQLIIVADHLVARYSR